MVNVADFNNSYFLYPLITKQQKKTSVKLSPSYSILSRHFLTKIIVLKLLGINQFDKINPSIQTSTLF